MPTLLITGGCGFIGSHLLRATLAAYPDHTVVNLDRLTVVADPETIADLADEPRLTTIVGDIADARLVEDIFRTNDVTAVLHCAAESHVDRSIESAAPFVGTNVVGTQVLLENARRAWAGCADRAARRFLHVSTDEVFGSIEGEGRFREDSPYAPRSPYAASKAGADHLVRAFHRTHDLPTVVTHATNNFGSHQFPEKLIPVVVLAARDGRPVPIYGDGRQVRDWIAVEDHVAALLTLLAEGRPGESYCIGGEIERENLALATLLCDTVESHVGPLPDGRPRRSLIEHVPDRPGHDRRYAIDPSKLRRETGWRARVPFEEGIARTVAWILENEAWVARALARLHRKEDERG